MYIGKIGKGDLNVKIKIAVCDSDTEAGTALKERIGSQKKGAQVQFFASAEELLAFGEEFDIYFLDIKGAGGMALARCLRAREQGRRHIIIFVTGYREYMEAAFDVQAFHYLVKPIDREKFAQVLDKACREAEFLHQQWENHVLLKVRGRDGEMESRKVLLRDIRFVESNNKNVIFHTEGGAFPAQGTMEEFEERLGPGFYRCHRCYLVNLACITAYSQREIKVTGGETVMLAHKKYGAFVKAYLRHAKGGGLINV